MKKKRQVAKQHAPYASDSAETIIKRESPRFLKLFMILFHCLPDTASLIPVSVWLSGKHANLMSKGLMLSLVHATY